MMISRRQFVVGTAAGLVVPSVYAAANNQAVDRELTGKTLCGYQGWFNTEGDGYGLGFRHYRGRGGFRPGHCTIDLWPDVSEFDADERFDTAFRHKDGRTAQVYSAAHPKTIARHFDWMRDYGVDGVAVQRFGTNLRNKKMLAHHNAIIRHARESAKHTGRLWQVMYDLSGMKRGEPQRHIAEDWLRFVEQLGVTDDPTYLHHQGKPLISIWGVGFNDNRQYTIGDCAELIDRVRMDGRFSVMLGTPYYWRTQQRDAARDPGLHDVLRKADVISPWSVGRYATPEQAIERGEDIIEPDLAWCRQAGKHYLPVIFPGFSWHNLKKTRGEQAELDSIPRHGGRFLWSQAEAARSASARSLYVAMFDEIDEGTAIFKCTNDPPVGDSAFHTYEGLPSDHYLWLTGKIAGRLRQDQGREITPMPNRVQ